MNKIKVLFLAASPAGAPLRLDEEIRQIINKIRAAEHRDSLDVVSRFAVRPDDLQQSLLEHQPHVVHFSGHGSQSEEIILLDDQSNPKPVSKQALVDLLTTLKDNIQVVLLNACYSRPQAEAITQVIDCAIGMNRAIGDKAAITFAASFYRAIGFGRSVQTAFELGKSALELEGTAGTQIPELVVRQGVVPSEVVLLGPSPGQDVADTEDRGQAGATGNGALVVWQEKLDFLAEQEAVLSDPVQKFALRKQMEEVMVKIEGLSV